MELGWDHSFQVSDAPQSTLLLLLGTRTSTSPSSLEGKVPRAQSGGQRERRAIHPPKSGAWAAHPQPAQGPPAPWNYKNHFTEMENNLIIAQHHYLNPLNDEAFFFCPFSAAQMFLPLKGGMGTSRSHQLRRKPGQPRRLGERVGSATAQPGTGKSEKSQRNLPKKAARFAVTLRRRPRAPAPPAASAQAPRKRARVRVHEQARGSDEDFWAARKHFTKHYGAERRYSQGEPPGRR